MLGLVVFSVAALYVYYPAPGDAFDDIVGARAYMEPQVVSVTRG